MKIPLVAHVRPLQIGEPVQPGDLVPMKNEDGRHTKVAGATDAEHQTVKWRLIGPDGREMSRNYSD